MEERKPIAFLSYVHSDDLHDHGRITKLRERLEGEVQMQTGQQFPIFQDRNDLRWGQMWQERISSSLADVTFLIPIITPSYFQSPMCRDEFDKFLLKEETLGFPRLILPLYYVQADEMDDESAADPMVAVLRARQWTDWRGYRFKQHTDELVSGALASMAGMLKAAIREVRELIEAEDRSAAASNLETSQRVASGPTVLFKPKRAVASRKSRRRSEKSVPTAVSFNRYELEDDGPPLIGTAADLVIAELRAEGAFDEGYAATVRNLNYFAYTKKFDEVIKASDISTSDETLRLHEASSTVATLFEVQRGSELAALERRLAEAAAGHSTAVYILVDNSGSMRGRPIAGVTAWLQIMTSVFDRAGIHFEIAGYTTRTWKGGRARELWVQDGAPRPPGRLNDLRYILYKTFDEAARSAAPNISIMGREGLLKENVDGEALAWASERLKAFDADRKLLLVLSDGAPVDDTTLALSGQNYLWRHLQRVAGYLQTVGWMRLSAVGIGYDLTAVYGDGARLAQPDNLGLVALRATADALEDARV